MYEQYRTRTWRSDTVGYRNGDAAVAGCANRLLLAAFAPSLSSATSQCFEGQTSRRIRSRGPIVSCPHDADTFGMVEDELKKHQAIQTAMNRLLQCPEVVVALGEHIELQRVSGNIEQRRSGGVSKIVFMSNGNITIEDAEKVFPGREINGVAKLKLEINGDGKSAIALTILVQEGSDWRVEDLKFRATDGADVIDLLAPLPSQIQDAASE